MPCDSYIRNEVQWQAGTDLAVLEAAMKELGYTTQLRGNVLTFADLTANPDWLCAPSNRSGAGTFTNGKMDFPMKWGEGIDQAIKREYSRQSVLASAKKLGWLIKADAKDKYKMQIRKRA